MINIPLFDEMDLADLSDFLQDDLDSQLARMTDREIARLELSQEVA